MNIMLIGNGFDIHYNLPTKYHNFLHVVDFLQNYYDDSMTTVGAVFNDARFHGRDKFIDGSYSSYKDIYDQTPLPSDEITQLIALAKTNLWYNYLLSTYNKDVGWIDFEKEISTVCSYFEKLFESKTRRFSADSKELSVFYDNSQESAAYRYIIFEKFDFFLHPNLYRRNEIVTNKVGQPIFSPEFSRKVIPDYYLNVPFGSDNLVLNTEKIVATLSAQLESLSEMLIIYLRSFVENVCDKLVGSEIIRPLGLPVDNVITFNYTNTYEKLDESANVIHIHGCLDDKIVLGINPDCNDNLDTVDTTFIAFKKYFQRTISGTDLPYLDFIKTIRSPDSSIENEFVHLYVFGHSLDVTDSDIIKDLFASSDEITILCHSNTAVGSYIANLIKIFGKDSFDKFKLENNLRFRVTGTELESVIEEEQQKRKKEMDRQKALADFNLVYS